MPITIRRIASNEGPMLREVRLRALKDAPQAFGTRYEEALDEPESEWVSTARASARGDRRAYFLAIDDADSGRPSGMVQARRRPPADCLLFSMWVTPEARRSGVGAALVDAVSDWGGGWGAKKVVLWVTGVNEGAQRFYERIGFRLLNDGPDAESGSRFGAFAMERPIET